MLQFFFSSPGVRGSRRRRRKPRKTQRVFTLIEVVVALAILTVSIASLLSLLMSSRSKITKSVEKWREMHMLMQGAEYLLLHDTTLEGVPERFFPYQDYRITVEYQEIDDLPEEMQGQSGQVELQACVIRLSRISDGKELNSVIVDRLMFESALSEE